MRVYSYLSVKEILYAGAYGLKPLSNLTAADKYLLNYANKHDIYLIVGNKRVRADSPYVYGSVIYRSKILEDMVIRKGKGIFIFFKVNQHTDVPVFVGNYDLKVMLNSALTLNKMDLFPKKLAGLPKSKAMAEIARIYWKSVISVKDYYTHIKENAVLKYPAINKRYASYKYSMISEVMAYTSVPAGYLFVKTDNKTFVPFMDWLYAHRGLYIKRIRNSEGAEKEKWEQLYERFMKNYNTFEATIAKRVRGKKRVVGMYVT